MKKFISFGSVVAIALPFSAFAADAFSLIDVIANILNRIIPVLIILAVVYFIWGVIQYTVAQDEEKKKKARGAIIQGLIGLFVIIAFWGIIAVLENTFHVGPAQIHQSDIPCIPVPTANITC